MPTGREETLPAPGEEAGATHTSARLDPVVDRATPGRAVGVPVIRPDSAFGASLQRSTQPADSDTQADEVEPATVRGVTTTGTDAHGSAAAEVGVGVETGADASQTGADERRRGWFWHWNSVVTQYAPLIGLKGVGLINSYTVWTDRREGSAHRGYAFPSQQSEADFYGEERSELITINKLLVALDLIEIRKEMIQRTDERGRKWRVPHNLYRVRDRDDGMQLRAGDVLRVADLAARDPAVFRYVRRIFSDRFKPIDRDNVWHTILTEIASDPTWQELRARNQAIEQRASARTKAGHRTRSGSTNDDSGVEVTNGQLSPILLSDDEQPVVSPVASETAVALSNDGFRTVQLPVAVRSNTGLVTDVGVSSNGLTLASTRIPAGFNTGRPSSVGPSNTTYHQLQPTTTTTTTSRELEIDGEVASPVDGADENARPASSTSRRASGRRSERPGSQQDKTEHESRARDERQELDETNGTTNGTQSMTQPVPLAAPAGIRMGSDDDWDGSKYGVANPDGGGSRVRVESESGVLDDDDARTTDAAIIDRASSVTHSTGGTHSHGLACTAEPGEAGSTTDDRPAPRGADSGHGRPAGGAARERRLDFASGDAGGPLGDPSPLVVSLFEAANDRRAKPLERTLLAELERDADPPARAAGSSGSAWVAAALREAVASGSSFVAPKRIREIIARWAVSGMPQPTTLGQASENGRPALTGTTPAVDTPPLENLPPSAADMRDDVRLPGGRSGGATWTAVLSDLRRSLDPAAFERLLAGSAIVRYWRGTVEIMVPSVAAVEKLTNEYRGLIERTLNARLRRPVSVIFVLTAVPAVHGDDRADDSDSIAEATYPTSASENTDDGSTPLVVTQADLDLGRQLWRAMLDDLPATIPPDDRDALTGGAVLGEDTIGALLIAGLSPRAQRLIEGRHRPAVEAALARLLGRSVVLRCLAVTDWRAVGAIR